MNTDKYKFLNKKEDYLETAEELITSIRLLELRFKRDLKDLELIRLSLNKYRDKIDRTMNLDQFEEFIKEIG